MTIKPGTLCYVLPDEKKPWCDSMPPCAGSIVAIVGGPFPAQMPGPGWIDGPHFMCEQNAVRYGIETRLVVPISDPSADITERADEKEPVAA